MLAELAAEVRSSRLAAAANALESLPRFRQEQLLRHMYPPRGSWRQRSSSATSSTASGEPGKATAKFSPRSPVLISQCSSLPVSAREAVVNALGRDTWLSVELAAMTGNSASQARKALFALDSGQPGSTNRGKERVEAVHMAFKKPTESVGKSAIGSSDAMAGVGLFGEEENAAALDAHSAATGHRSVCISSQAGCALACAFCATGRVGLKRQLTADEITDQVLWWMHAGERVDTVSFMGMGEPLANPRTFDALRMLIHPSLFGFAPSRVSVSTVGNVPAMRRLTSQFPRVNLAFSMHSPFNEQRSELVPNNKTHPLADCWDAVLDHIDTTRRKVFVAYLVLAGTNDSREHARELARWLEKAPTDRRHLLHVNLLRYNPAQGIIDHWPRTPVNTTLRFQNWLEEFGVRSISTRQSFGLEEDAACGQLFASYDPKPTGHVPKKFKAPPSMSA